MRRNESPSIRIQENSQKYNNRLQKADDDDINLK